MPDAGCLVCNGKGWVLGRPSAEAPGWRKAGIELAHYNCPACGKPPMGAWQGSTPGGSLDLDAPEMTPNEYQQAALGTDGDDEFYMAANCRLGSHWAGFDKMRLLHASVGLCTEAGELQDALKKHIFYGREFDWTNAVEEVGDLLWYAALACKALGTTLEDAMERNIAKLRARYPEKFEAQRAIERDLAAERAALEGK